MSFIRKFATLFIVFCSAILYAQAPGDEHIEMADRLKADGKIYVVIGVVLIIVIGLFIYLFSIDRKVSKLEKELAENKEKQQS